MYLDHTLKRPRYAIGRLMRKCHTGIAAYTTPRISVSGTATPSCNESDIVTGGKTLILTLRNAQWAPSGATFNATRQAILDGLVSRGSQAAGWNAKRAAFAVTTVARTSATVVTVTFPATAAYSIATTNEIVDITVPAAAIQGQSGPAKLVGSFTILADA